MLFSYSVESLLEGLCPTPSVGISSFALCGARLLISRKTACLDPAGSDCASDWKTVFAPNPKHFVRPCSLRRSHSFTDSQPFNIDIHGIFIHPFVRGVQGLPPRHKTNRVGDPGLRPTSNRCLFSSTRLHPWLGKRETAYEVIVSATNGLLGARSTSSRTDDCDWGAAEPDETVDGRKSDPEQSGEVVERCGGHCKTSIT